MSIAILFKNICLYLPLWLLTAMYFIPAGIYPARRFLLEYAFVFKGIFLSLCTLAVWRYWGNVHRTSKMFNALLVGFGLAITASVLVSHYPVRAGSECDMLLASFAFSYLFWLYGGVSIKHKMRLLGAWTLVFLHFSACLCLACDHIRQGFIYPWKILFRDYFFNLDSIFRFLFVSSKRVRCPLDYSNYMGYFGGLVLPFFIALMCSERRKRFKTLWFLGILYAATVVFASKSRAAWLLSAFIGVCWLLLGLKRLRLSCFWKIGILVLLGTIFGTTAWRTGRIQKKLQYLVKGDLKGFVSNRSYLAQDGWKLVQKKPFFGHGMTTLPWHYLEAEPEAVHHCWQLHVAPLQFLFEFGLFGGITFGGLLLLIVWRGFKNLRNRLLPHEQRFYGFGCLTSVIFYLLFNSEDSWCCFALSAWIALMLGGCRFFGTEIENTCISRKTPVVSGIFAMVLAVCIGCSVCDLQGRCFFQKFVRRACAGDVDCELDLQRAVEADPHNLYYYNHGGCWNICCGFPQSAPHVRRALMYYERSLRLNPNQPEILESCGALCTALGNISQAVDYYTKAIHCLPCHTFAWIQLLEILRQHGTRELYDEWLATATFAMPRAVFSQPQLLKDLRARPSAQRRCMELFEQQEVSFGSVLAENPEWQFEKYLRYRLFFNEERDLPKLELTFLPVFERLKADNTWEVLLQTAEEAPLMKNRYSVHLQEGNTDRIRSHGGAAPDIQIATACLISQPKLKNLSLRKTKKVFKALDREKKLAFFTANGIANYTPKHARDVLNPLIEKTRQAFERLPEKSFNG